MSGNMGPYIHTWRNRRWHLMFQDVCPTFTRNCINKKHSSKTVIWLLAREKTFRSMKGQCWSKWKWKWQERFREEVWMIKGLVKVFLQRIFPSLKTEKTGLTWIETLIHTSICHYLLKLSIKIRDNWIKKQKQKKHTKLMTSRQASVKLTYKICTALSTLSSYVYFSQP